MQDYKEVVDYMEFDKQVDFFRDIYDERIEEGDVNDLINYIDFAHMIIDKLTEKQIKKPIPPIPPESVTSKF